MTKPYVVHTSFNGSEFACGLKKRIVEIPPDNRVMCYACAMVLLTKYNELCKTIEQL